MMRSMYSGVSGLRVHQTKMDVIGNNIANVNTVGFKASRATFSELFYQKTQSASGPDGDTGTGGRNAKQIGLGSSLSSIDVDITTEGGNQTTNRPFDLKINGEAFFIVQSKGETYFTKAGNFRTDEAGDLVTETGAYVMGYVADKPGATLQKDQLRPISVYGPKYTNTDPEATSAASFSGNINQEDSSFADGKPITRYIYVYDNLGYQYGVQVQITQNDLDNYTVTANGVYPITVDFSKVTKYGTETTIDSKKGDYGDNGAGKKVGTMISVGVDTNGNIVAAYDNGDNEVIGQVAVSTFVNPSGLEKVGENMYAATLNSGAFNGIGEEIAATGGSISPGVLEMSNVDLASEFTDMIVTQRGFQANSRIITTSDSMIEELLSLKR